MAQVEPVADRAEHGQVSLSPPGVTVIIPVYNGARALGRCLQALGEQTVPRAGFEVLVVDDGSTDRSAEIARGYGATVLARRRRSGPSAARNTGAEHAQGSILVFIDADCEASPQWLAEMLRPLADPAVSGVYGRYASRQAELVARFAQAEFDERYERLARRESVDFVAGHAAAFQRSAFLAARGFRTELWGNEDVDIAFRLSRQGHRLVFAPRAIVYHEHPSSLLRYLATKASRGYWRAIVYARHPQKAVSDSYTPPWLKVQAAGLAALAVAIAGGAVAGGLRVAGLLLGALVLASTYPFTRFVWQRDRRLVLVSPFLSLARSAALAAGALAGLAAAASARLAMLALPAPRSRDGWTRR